MKNLLVILAWAYALVSSVVAQTPTNDPDQKTSTPTPTASTSPVVVPTPAAVPPAAATTPTVTATPAAPVVAAPASAQTNQLVFVVNGATVTVSYVGQQAPIVNVVSAPAQTAPVAATAPVVAKATPLPAPTVPQLAPGVEVLESLDKDVISMPYDIKDIENAKIFPSNTSGVIARCFTSWGQRHDVTVPKEGGYDLPKRTAKIQFFCREGPMAVYIKR